MSTWAVSTKDSNDNWQITETIPRPQEDLEDELMSTQTKINLANGDIAYVNPEINSIKQDLNFKWYLDDNTLRTQIRGYIDNLEDIKITTHESGIEFIGRFISVKSRWLVGCAPDEFEIEAVFSQMDIT